MGHTGPVCNSDLPVPSLGLFFIPKFQKIWEFGVFLGFFKVILGVVFVVFLVFFSETARLRIKLKNQFFFSNPSPDKPHNLLNLNPSSLFVIPFST